LCARQVSRKTNSFYALCKKNKCLVKSFFSIKFFLIYTWHKKNQFSWDDFAST
jgi:hypothetical protein